MKTMTGVILSGALMVLLGGCESTEEIVKVTQGGEETTQVVEGGGSDTAAEQNLSQAPDTNRTTRNDPPMATTPGGEETAVPDEGDAGQTDQATADTTPPVITLRGKKRMTIRQGERYVDPGIVVTDNRDGRITVTVKGEVDTSRPGTYTLVYRARDKAGNTAYAKRYVTVKEKKSEDTNDNDPDTGTDHDNGDNSGENDTGTGDTEKQHVVTVLVMYDQRALKHHGDKQKLTTRIHHLFALANQAYKESNIPAKIEAVDIAYFKTSKTNQDALVALRDSQDVRKKREQHRADMVLLYQANDDGSGQCGISYVPHRITKPSDIKDIMFAQVHINCPDTTTPHELGHNMGLRHSHKQNGDTGVKPYNYGLGHGVDKQFGTIMTYNYLFHVNTLTNKFSSPEYNCAPGYACGIAVGEPGEADAARVLKMTIPIVEKVYE
jgi:hypothetical protein